MENKSNSKYEINFFSEHPFEEMMKHNSFFPTIKEIIPSTKEKNIPEETKFLKYFSFFQDFIDEVEKKYFLFINEKKDEVIKKTTEQITEIFKVFIQEEAVKLNDLMVKLIGEELLQLRDRVKQHISIFFGMACKYIPFHKYLSEYDINILKWTILFHDLGKFVKMNPIIEENYPPKVYIDRAHPLKSTIIFLQFIIKNKLLKINSQNDEAELTRNFNDFKNALFNSYEIIYLPKYNCNGFNISFNKIEEIKEFLLYLKSLDNIGWIYDITVLILFHQSLPNNKSKMHNPLLPDNYIKMFFTSRLVELMRIIMVYDSASHDCYIEGDWTANINLNIDELQTRLFS